MFCTQCGAELAEEDLFCGSCGKQRKDAPLRRPQGSGLRLDERNIIALLGIESLPDEGKISIVKKVNELVQKRLLLRIMDFLDDEKTGEFERLVDSLDAVDEAGEAGSKLSVFFQANVPMLDTWLIEEVNRVKETLAGVGEAADAELSEFKPGKT